MFDHEYNNYNFMFLNMMKNLKKKSNVIRLQVCPICGRKNVNLYRTKDNKWFCKKCIDDNGYVMEV